ncbi:4367_t:CDS:2 [Paraglomus occultum]|uniref:4367_t:CDS:1 n=1 Tax=Paraglomus occultum TaxID=144539 RepID=A0A9N8ZPA2_9GLOM|nr:4367_t:CDS:2 [Paraglomus occultum]
MSINLPNNSLSLPIPHLPTTQNKDHTKEDTPSHATKRGRKESAIWGEFERGEKINSAHYQAFCLHCRRATGAAKGIGGTPYTMRRHLLACLHVPIDVKSKYELPSDVATDPSFTPTKRRKTVTSITRSQENLSNSSNQLNQEKAVLDRQVLRTLLATGSDFSWVENAESIALVRLLRSTYKLPSSRALSNEILDTEYNVVKQEIDRTINEATYITIATDGWSSQRPSDFVNFLVINQNRNAELYDVLDISNERHQAEKIVSHIDEISCNIGVEKVAAIIFDNGGNHSRVQKSLNDKNPRVLVLPCMAHQTNLLIAYILNAAFKTVVENILSVVDFFRSYSNPMDMLRQISNLPDLVLPRPYLSNWESLYHCANTLHLVQASFMPLANHPAAFNTQNKIGATVLRYIKNDEFWSELNLFCTIMHPYAKIVEVFQSPGCSISEVMVYWIILYSRIQQMHIVPELQQRLLRFMNKRWSYVDQSYFLATWLLHPYHRGNGIIKNRINDIIERTLHFYKKIMGVDDQEYESAFVDQLLNFVYKEREFARAFLTKESLTRNPLRFWSVVADVAPQLSAFATRLFSIPPSAVSPERAWSVVNGRQGNVTGLLDRSGSKFPADKITKMQTINWHLKQQAVSSSVMSGVNSNSNISSPTSANSASDNTMKNNAGSSLVSAVNSWDDQGPIEEEFLDNFNSMLTSAGNEDDLTGAVSLMSIGESQPLDEIAVIFDLNVLEEFMLTR